MQLWLKKIISITKFPITLLIASVVGMEVLSYVENSMIGDKTFFVLAYYACVLLFFSSVMWLIYKVIDWIIKEKESNAFTYFIVTLRSNIILLLSLLLINYLILPILNLSDFYYFILHKLLTVSIIITCALIVIRIITLIEQIVIFKYQSQNDFKAKSAYTKTHILRQIAIFFILIITCAGILMTFESVRELGISLIASTGVLGVIIGFAAQKTLSGIVGGLQIAFTQPIRIGDAVVINTEFGVIEEITLTYVVVKVWDGRRLIVPVNYFLENVFQNWTRSSLELLGTVFINVDYNINIEALRHELSNILNQSVYWNKKVGLIDLTELKENFIELRVLVSANNADNLWRLRCEVREKLLSYITHRYPGCLPIFRIHNA